MLCSGLLWFAMVCFVFIRFALFLLHFVTLCFAFLWFAPLRSVVQRLDLLALFCFVVLCFDSVLVTLLQFVAFCFVLLCTTDFFCAVILFCFGLILISAYYILLREHSFGFVLLCFLESPYIFCSSAIFRLSFGRICLLLIFSCYFVLFVFASLISFTVRWSILLCLAPSIKMC